MRCKIFLKLWNDVGEEKRTESIKRYKLFLAVASKDRIGFSNDFPALPATLQKVPGAIGTGSGEKK